MLRRCVSIVYATAAHTIGAAGEAAKASRPLFLLGFAWNERNCGRTVRRFTRHAAADELSELQEASLKYSGFSRNKDGACEQSSARGDFRRRAGRLIMAQERDDLVYLAKLAEQAERFDEMVERRRCTHMRRAAA